VVLDGLTQLLWPSDGLNDWWPSQTGPDNDIVVIVIGQLVVDYWYYYCYCVIVIDYCYCYYCGPVIGDPVIGVIDPNPGRIIDPLLTLLWQLVLLLLIDPLSPDPAQILTQLLLLLDSWTSYWPVIIVVIIVIVSYYYYWRLLLLDGWLDLIVNWLFIVGDYWPIVVIGQYCWYCCWYCYCCYWWTNCWLLLLVGIDYCVIVIVIDWPRYLTDGPIVGIERTQLVIDCYCWLVDWTQLLIGRWPSIEPVADSRYWLLVGIIIGYWLLVILLKAQLTDPRPSYCYCVIGIGQYC